MTTDEILHDCNARSREKVPEWVCPDCGETWLFFPESNLWTTEAIMRKDAELRASWDAADIQDVPAYVLDAQ